MEIKYWKKFASKTNTIYKKKKRKIKQQLLQD